MHSTITRTRTLVLAVVLGTIAVGGCTSADAGARADLDRSGARTAGLGNYTGHFTNEASGITGPGPVDYVNTEFFDAASHWPEATAILYLGDDQYLIGNDTGRLTVASITMPDGTVIEGLEREMAPQIQAAAVLQAQLAEYLSSLPAEQTRQFIELMDTTRGWQRLLGDVAGEAFRAALPVPQAGG